MPGTTTPNSFPFPFVTETVDSDSVKNLADAVDTKLASSIAAATVLNRRPAALVMRDTGTQSFATGAALANLTYTTEKFDNDTMGNLGTNNERLTVVTAGVYQVTARAQFSSGIEAISAWLLAITINGTVLAGSKRRGAPTGIWVSSGPYDISATLVRRLSAADIIRAQFTWTGTGSPKNITRAELGARWLCSL